MRLLCLVLLSSTALAIPLSELESPVQETSGTQQEIIQRAQNCVARLVRFDAVQAHDALGQRLFGLPQQSTQDVIPGGEVLVSSDPQAGILIANNRVAYKAARMAHSAQSTLTILVKEGRFKVRHENIQVLLSSTGYAKNEGYIRAEETSPSAKGARVALEQLSEKLSACINQAAEDW
jgi:hypothetical protein